MSTETSRHLDGPSAALTDPVRPTDYAIAAGYLAVFAAGQILIFLRLQEVGLVVFSAALVALLVHAAGSAQRRIYALLVALGCIPILRLLDLGLPLLGLPLVFRYLVISVPLLAPVILIMGELGYSTRDVGLTRGRLPVQALVALSGVPLGFALGLVTGQGWTLTQFPPASQAFPAAILLFTTGFVEELIFRGLVQRAVTRSLGPLPGLVYPPLLYTIVSIGAVSPQPFPLLLVLSINVLYSWVFARTGSIAGTAVSHGLLNIMLLIVMPLGPLTGQ